MKHYWKYAALLALMCIAGGCAVGQSYSVVNVKPEFEPEGKAAVAIASHDQRPYVVSGRNEPQFVGLLRGGFGNPFYMMTTSGRPLADEMGDVISNALKKKGFKTTSVIVASNDSSEQVQKKLIDTGADKLIYFRAKEWKSDAYAHIRLIYTLHLSVLDDRGAILADKEISGDESLGGAGVNVAGTIKKKVPTAFKEKLQELFNAPEIENALEN